MPEKRLLNSLLLTSFTLSAPAYVQTIWINSIPVHSGPFY